MASIKGKDTKPELLLRQGLYRRGIRYRIHGKLPGKPDVVIHRKKIVIFIDGCFWHKCPKCFVQPKTNRAFWRKKIDANAMRDRNATRKLRALGWKVIRIREHRLEKNQENTIAAMVKVIKATAP